jgi:DNA-binding response OmpR family regulator
MAKLLFVDDDEALSNGVSSYLSLQGHVLDLCSSGEDALQLLDGFSYDLIVLDWGLPGISGEDVCRAFRSKEKQTPILFLTGKEDITFLERAFEAGADDYVLKPFNVRELAARIKTLIRRRTGTFVADLRIGDLLLRPEKNLISVNSTEVQLRAKETALLEFLIRHPNKVYSAQELLDAVWPADSARGTNCVRTWMNFLRNKLKEAGQENLIKTILGSGYIIEDATVGINQQP